MNKCGTCKHWGTPVFGNGECKLLSRNEDGYLPDGSDHPSDKLVHVSAAELPVWFSTTAEFGCILWEQK